MEELAQKDFFVILHEIHCAKIHCVPKQNGGFGTPLRSFTTNIGISSKMNKFV